MAVFALKLVLDKIERLLYFADVVIVSGYLGQKRIGAIDFAPPRPCCDYYAVMIGPGTSTINSWRTAGPLWPVRVV